MKSIAIIGSSSNLSIKIKQMLFDFEIKLYGRKEEKSLDVLNLSTSNIIDELNISEHDIYIFNLGKIIPEKISTQTEEEIIESLKVNALFTIKASELILERNQSARIIIIGSESGRKGSFDTTYFLSKSMLRAYVKQRYLFSTEQQLVLISPSTISDSRMTMDREDKARLSEYESEHPKKRFIFNDEISEVICNLIRSKSTYITNTEIEMNGGKFARMKYQ
ncbi:SDR family oxidoreductase [Vibrio mediterranei]|uniref:SDR family oxidoreductase n=1 Tax=Vibrio mediterranei TaxID=689 RepID=UPI001EFCDF70|nr:SDR family oxidoreductase [Vibrio mediterranei]MCG9666045.1 SDR family oxidoreductase [Vibrio mediterranei]